MNNRAPAKSRQLRQRGSHESGGDLAAGPLIEQHGTHRGIVHVYLLRVGDAHRQATRGGRAGLDLFAPAHEMREVVNVLAHPLPRISPADTRHIGDRILAGEERAIATRLFITPNRRLTSSV